MRKITAPFKVFSPNLQCLFGAALGMAALFLPWLLLDPGFAYPRAIGIGYTPVFEGSAMNLFQVVALIPGSVKLFCALFAAGAALSFFTPLGGILQSVGLVAFAFGHAAWGEYGFPVRLVGPFISDDLPIIYIERPFALGIGYLVAVLSTFMVLTSTTSAVRAARVGPVVHNRVAALAWNTARTR